MLLETFWKLLLVCWPPTSQEESIPASSRTSMAASERETARLMPESCTRPATCAPPAAEPAPAPGNALRMRGRGRRTVELEDQLVRVAPVPVLERLVRPDHGMPHGV